MKSPLTSLLGTLLITLAATSCSDQPEPSDTITAYDIVCLESVTSTVTTFTLTKPNGSELIRYHAAGRFDTTYVKPSQRLMLAYIPALGTPYRSGNIKPIGYSLIHNDSLRHGYITNHRDWDKDPVYMLSAWMSQDYLNLRARLPYDTHPRVLGLLVDSLTLDTPYPDCYLIHTLDGDVNSFDRNYYMSFDVSSLRHLDNCRGFNLIINNSNMKIDKYIFTLNNNNHGQ